MEGLPDLWTSFWMVRRTNPWEMVLVVPLFTAIVAFARWALYSLVFAPLSRALVPKSLPTGGGKRESWFERRRKFMESSWKLLYYGAVWAFTWYCCSTNEDWNNDSADGKSWFWDTTTYFKDPVNHDVSLNMKLVLVLQLAFYWFSLFSVLVPAGWELAEVQRSDRVEMALHHGVTVVLITCSWAFHHVRPGIVILLIHDISDIFMEAAKILNYMQKQKLCDSMFVLFTVVWFYSRLYLYPLYPLYETYRVSDVVPYAAAAYVPLLAVLQVLHVYWSVLILRMVYRFLIVKQVDGDIREDEKGVQTSKVE